MCIFGYWALISDPEQNKSQTKKFKSWKWRPISAKSRLSQKGWCNKPTKLQFQSNLTRTILMLSNATNPPKQTVELHEVFVLFKRWYLGSRKTATNQPKSTNGLPGVCAWFQMIFTIGFVFVSCLISCRFSIATNTMLSKPDKMKEIWPSRMTNPLRQIAIYIKGRSASKCLILQWLQKNSQLEWHQQLNYCHYPINGSNLPNSRNNTMLAFLLHVPPDQIWGDRKSF